LILTGFGLSRWWRSGTITQENQAPFQSARLTRLTSGKALQVALAPDGKNIAYVKEETDGQSLWLRQVGVDSELRLIAPEQVNYLNVAFGGDGEVIYYTTTKANQGAGTIYEVPSLGGTPRKLLERVSSPFGLSHDDKHFAFLRAGEKEGTTSLIVANADGTDERQIAMTREPERWWGGMPPMWSPNGSRLACLTMNTGNVFGKFVAVRLNDGGIEDLTPNEWKLANGGEWTTNGLLVSAQQRDEDLFQLWHINPANGEARRVTNDLHDYFSVSLNAAGRTLATVQSVALTNVWLVDLSGASATRQTTSGAGVYWDISFTPDGKLLYSSRMSGLADIWQMDLDGANRLQLTKKAGSNYGPVVSPDGRYLFFHSNRAATYFIYRAHGDGSQPERLTNQTIEEATADCSPDGKTVVFVNYTPSGFPLKRVSVEGGTPILLSDKWVNQPAISPDGKLVACWYTETWGEAWRLALIPLETGGAPIKTFSVPPTAAWGGRIRWTPDGRGLLYVDTRNGVSNIWQQATDGGVPVQVTNFETEVIFSFALTPDGKQLACVRGTIAQDVVLLSDQPND
jgi:Tol biopolymer transport system component